MPLRQPDFEGVRNMVKSEEAETERPSGGRLQKLCGSRQDTVSLVLKTQALNTLYHDSHNDEMREAFVTANLALMEDFAPRDAIEAMLATQIIGTHNLKRFCPPPAATGRARSCVRTACGWGSGA